MAFACCESCGSAEPGPTQLRYGGEAGTCPHCGGRMFWMATPFAQRLAERRRMEPGVWSAFHLRKTNGNVDAERL